jgi:vacuolar-type H+-ATPase subunit I/STV1
MTPDLTFNVGQVIYLLAKKDARVYPVLVTEQINKKTLLGNSTSYVVRLPTEENKEVNLDEVNSEIFVSLDSARESMIQRASSQIDLILEKAKSIADIFPQSEKCESDEAGEENKKLESDDDFAFVDLGDGQKARLNIKDLEKIKGEDE